ncbi:MAG: hypothetical protein FJZ97_11330 [Chloroflexi bacterium]|nr:hypothetical protein [Chloroflexota bacterium]
MTKPPPPPPVPAPLVAVDGLTFRYRDRSQPAIRDTAFAETWWTRRLLNRTSFTIQRRLLFSGLQAVILPIRVRLKRESIPK